MKSFCTLILLFIQLPFIIAQNSEELQWTGMLDINKTEIFGKSEILMDTPSHLLGEINGILVYKTVKSLYGIKDGKIIYAHKTKIDGYKGERIEVFQDKLLYFSIKKRNLFLTEYSLETGLPIGETIQLTDDLPEKDFYIRPLKNKNFLALNFHLGNLTYNEASDCFHYLVLNSDLKVIHSNEVNNEVKYLKREGEHLPILMDDGRVLFFYKHEDEGHYNFKIHSEDGIVEGQYDVPKGSLERQELMNDPELFLQENGTIKAFWTFMDSDKKFKPKDGKRHYKIASFSIDKTGNTTSLNKSASILSYPNAHKEYGVFNLLSNKLHFRQRKGYLLPNEQAYIGLGETEFMDSHVSESGVPKPNLYLFDIYVYKLDKTGELVWSTKIRKRQPKAMNYGSYSSFISGDEMWILFNDGVANYKNGVYNVPEGDLAETAGMNKGCIALIKLNLETGEHTRIMAEKIENVGGWIAPIDHYLSNNKIQILAGRNSKSRILSIDIE